MIRACVDANVLISYLLYPPGNRPPIVIVRAGVAQVFDLVIIETTLGEVANSVRTKPKLARRIDLRSVDQLETALRIGATVIPESNIAIPKVTRDPSDDYLVAHAILNGIPMIISGDDDLLDLGEFEGVTIVSPADFVAILSL